MIYLTTLLVSTVPHDHLSCYTCNKQKNRLTFICIIFIKKYLTHAVPSHDFLALFSLGELYPHIHIISLKIIVMKVF